MAGESTYNSISSLVANIYEGALLVASETSVMVNLVRNYRDTTSLTPRVFSSYTGGTIVSLAEISDLTAQTFNPAASGTITPALFGQQYYLTDARINSDGFYRDRVAGDAAPGQLVWMDRRFGTPRKADAGGVLLYTRESLAEFPDLWVAGLDFADARRLSDANPQQTDYRWPSVELVKWVSGDGIPLKGLLYKPDDFDPSKQYPMIVYYYEILSDGLHTYSPPSGRNTVNPTVYTSLGYLVFFPDIVYEVGWPGPCAVKAIVPGEQSLIARGYVNPRGIGIAGQSWGGYQSAYLITQTSMFAAAVPNAPVANMTSAYGGLRWESGMARPFQYEKTQSRIGGSLWEYSVRFIENSPLFHLDRVTTPVLFMHNDGDGAVTSYQGIELFIGLRRLGKEAYMVNYNGDGHNPRKRANQKDIDLRMQQLVRPSDAACITLPVLCSEQLASIERSHPPAALRRAFHQAPAAGSLHRAACEDEQRSTTGPAHPFAPFRNTWL